MGLTVYTALTVVLATALLWSTGWWRLGFALFAIRPQRMTVKRLGLQVATASAAQRVDTLLRSFAGGFNAMIMKRSLAACWGYCDSLPVLYRPFAEEGLAMGYTLRHLFRYDAGRFEGELVQQRPQYRYLYYVGLGFWSGMRRHSPQQLLRITQDLDPLHRYLCYDGYGFKHAFFDFPRGRGQDGLAPLNELDGYARNAAYQGVGRAMWFLFGGRPELLIRHIANLDEQAADAAAGVGLAAVFVNPDQLEVARELGRKLPKAWHGHFHLGMCFALKARSLNDLDQFERDMASLDPDIREAAYASIRECDRVELLVRADTESDGYGRWRDTVAAWMAENVEYPLNGLKKRAGIGACEDISAETAQELRR
ncbi:MAG: DUF1702 family protein [Phycisphaerae bacterium]